MTQIGALSAVVLGGCAPGLVIPRCPEPHPDFERLQCGVAVDVARAALRDDVPWVTSIEFRYGQAVAHSWAVRADGQADFTVGHVVFTRADGTRTAVEVVRDGDAVTAVGPFVLDD